MWILFFCSVRRTYGPQNFRSEIRIHRTVRWETIWQVPLLGISPKGGLLKWGRFEILSVFFRIYRLFSCLLAVLFCPHSSRFVPVFLPFFLFRFLPVFAFSIKRAKGRHLWRDPFYEIQVISQRDVSDGGALSSFTCVLICVIEENRLDGLAGNRDAEYASNCFESLQVIKVFRRFPPGDEKVGKEKSVGKRKPN